MKGLILAAGIGSRLGQPYPKPLIMLANGQTIMERQVEALAECIGVDQILVVVGFKKELVMESFPRLAYVYNEYFDTTNTSKSLLSGLRKLQGHNVVWMNGDVVFDPRVIDRVIGSPGSCMAVNMACVGDEEVKYLTNGGGYITEVSKDVKGGIGESLGVNKVAAEHVSLLIKHLEACSDMDYFEKAVEMAIADGLRICPVDVSDLICREVDFVEDLVSINQQLQEGIIQGREVAREANH